MSTWTSSRQPSTTTCTTTRCFCYLHNNTTFSVVALTSESFKSTICGTFLTYTVPYREGTTGMTALMEAAQSGHEAIVQCFLDKVSHHAYMHYPTTSPPNQCTITLLEGVDTKIKSRSGKTARTYAMFRAHSNIVSAIQQYNRKTGGCHCMRGSTIDN